MKDIRIHQIMKQYNIGLSTISDFLRNNGIKVVNISINSKIPSSYMGLIESEFSKSAEQHMSATTIISHFKQARRTQSTQARVNPTEDKKLKEQFQSQSKINGISFTESTRINKDNESQIKRRRKERKQKRKTNNSPVIPILKEIPSAQPTRQYTYRNIPEINECVKIKWGDITFYDREIAFTYNKMQYHIDLDIAKESYNFIVKTFAKRLPPINVKISNSIALIVNDVEFDKVISILEIQNCIFNIENNGFAGVDIKLLNSIPRELLYTIFPINRTEYLEYLQELQVDDISILPVFETRQNAPDGFLFTVHRNDMYYVVWESNKHLAHKATYVFVVSKEEVRTLHQLLFDYITSGIDKKRYYLRHNQVTDFFGIEYHYIDHDGFSAWKTALDKLLHDRIKLGDKSKNENIVTYEVENRICTYTPVHNIIQNELKVSLEQSGNYKYVVLESDNVDIKALTPNDEWHYYEIKTSTARLCIREALGQILEYTHYNCHEKVTHLFIIGQYEPNDREVNYISLLRQLYKLPIYYRWYDSSTHKLSNCY